MRDTIHDPKLYAELSKPFATRQELADAIDAFDVELRALRAKHRLRDVLTVIGTSFIKEAGEPGEIIVYMHSGSDLQAVALAAHAFGRTQADHEDRIAATVAHGKKRR